VPYHWVTGQAEKRLYMKDLSSHILDIVQNSIRAKASLIGIEIAENLNEDSLRIAISDDGTGMSTEQLKGATDPFYTSRTTRKVGLGLSLLKQNAEMTGGTFLIDSELGKGTTVIASFTHSHFDRPVMGDLAGTLLLLICDSGQIDYAFKHETQSGVFQLDTRDVKQMLEDVPLNHPEIRSFMKEIIQENLEQIQIGE
jgi:hypothetical protein